MWSKICPNISPMLAGRGNKRGNGIGYDSLKNFVDSKEMLRDLWIQSPLFHFAINQFLEGFGNEQILKKDDCCQ